MTAILVAGYNPAATGCTATACATQHTTTLDSIHGRRCAQHPPAYRPSHHAKLIAAGQPRTADAYLNTWLWIEAGPEPEQVAA